MCFGLETFPYERSKILEIDFHRPYSEKLMMYYRGLIEILRDDNKEKVFNSLNYGKGRPIIKDNVISKELIRSPWYEGLKTILDLDLIPVHYHKIMTLTPKDYCVGANNGTPTVEKLAETAFPDPTERKMFLDNIETINKRGGCVVVVWRWEKR